MPKCEQCGKEVDLPFECKFCGSYFCVEHRLPESHNCPNKPPRTPLGGWQTRKEMAIARAKEKKDKFASEGDYHFVREESKSDKLKARKPFPTKKVVGVLIVISIIGVLVWQAPVILSYFQKSSYTKLTIANGQAQSVKFDDNEYAISYVHNPSLGLYRTLIITSPLLQIRQYQVFESQTINCDLGLEIKVDKVTDSYVTIYVKPLY